jgi:hypothetical protein
MSVVAASDYPFTSWNDYYAAFGESLSTEFYSETYPKYANRADVYINSDADIVKELLNSGLDSQEGLNGLIHTVVNNGRYALDMKRDIIDMMKLFVDHGAIPKVDDVFRLKYQSNDKKYVEGEVVCIDVQDFEDEVTYIKARGMMLDIISSFKFAYSSLDVDVQAFLGVGNTIVPMYWEEIPLQVHNYKTAFLMALAHESEYLRSII